MAKGKKSLVMDFLIPVLVKQSWNVCVGGGGRLKSNKVEKSPFKAVYKSPTKGSSDGDLIPSWYVQVLFSDFTPGLVHTGAVRRWKVTQEGPSSPFSLCFLITM